MFQLGECRLGLAHIASPPRLTQPGEEACWSTKSDHKRARRRSGRDLSAAGACSTPASSRAGEPRIWLGHGWDMSNAVRTLSCVATAHDEACLDLGKLDVREILTGRPAPAPVPRAPAASIHSWQLAVSTQKILALCRLQGIRCSRPRPSPAPTLTRVSWPTAGR